MVSMQIEEPKEAFHCRPPSERVKKEYQDIFSREEPLPDRPLKVVFDKVFAASALVLASPLLLGLFSANLIEGALIPENRGPFTFAYKAATAGRVFRKRKIRLIKTKYIDQELARQESWHAYSAEWSPESLTHVGRFVKAFYLDELPQLFTILRGDMSIVGPRPLAWHHYERDLAQGNMHRKLLKAGLLGPGQALKGTEDLGEAYPEYDYVRSYLTLSPLRLLWLDMQLVLKGIGVVTRARGL
jgi:lipopolysaccharide/colanic/teichoic acid biosynthesis glycosyltransferase